MNYQLLTLPIKGFRIVSCLCAEEWFDPNGFERADNRLAELRKQYPNGHFELLAEVSA